MIWRTVKTGIEVESPRIPADPGLMGCGVHGGWEDRNGETYGLICIKRFNHPGNHKFSSHLWDEK